MDCGEFAPGGERDTTGSLTASLGERVGSFGVLVKAKRSPGAAEMTGLFDDPLGRRPNNWAGCTDV